MIDLMMMIVIKLIVTAQTLCPLHSMAYLIRSHLIINRGSNELILFDHMVNFILFCNNEHHVKFVVALNFAI